jgi:Tfp pilus assembly protein PilO
MRRTDQIWIFGGLLAIILVVTGSWFLAISPKFTEADEVQSEADGASLQLIKLNKEVAGLIALEKQKNAYLAKLQASQTALPTAYNYIPAFVRQLQDSGSATNVDITGITVGTKAASPTVTSAIELPITLVAEGSVTQLSDFFVRLQNVQSRAVLVKSVALTEKADDSSDSASASPGGATANLTLSAFCLESKKKAAGQNCVLP